MLCRRCRRATAGDGPRPVTRTALVRSTSTSPTFARDELDAGAPALLAVHDVVDDGTAYRAELSAVGTDRVAVRQQYMDRAIPEFVGIPAPGVSCWATAHADVHWANLTESLRLLDWEGWGRSPEGFDAATLYAYSPLQPDTAARVRAAFPVLGSPAGLAAEATVCAQLLQTVSRGDNLTLADPLRDWSEELRRRQWRPRKWTSARY
ncbi:hypothetical protein [Streptomyces mirabilis]|uniref:hypothetical protein n=1 Tax=Streptomyces mirabilis TaxID=68239 RepID=UPI003699C9CA